MDAKRLSEEIDGTNQYQRPSIAKRFYSIV